MVIKGESTIGHKNEMKKRAMGGDYGVEIKKMRNGDTRRYARSIIGGKVWSTRAKGAPFVAHVRGIPKGGSPGNSLKRGRRWEGGSW